MEDIQIPINFLEAIHQELPPPNETVEKFITKYFSYNGKNLSITFYKVRDVGADFWLFNPYNVFEAI